MAYTRAHIRLETINQVTEFVKNLNSDGTTNKYVFESANGGYKANARSLLGAMYFSQEHGNEIYLVNESEDGYFPSFINSYRILEEKR